MLVIGGCVKGTMGNRMLCLVRVFTVCIKYSGISIKILYGPGHAKMCLMPYANNKGADQPAHPHSLTSTFLFAA